MKLLCKKDPRALGIEDETGAWDMEKFSAHIRRCKICKQAAWNLTGRGGFRGGGRPPGTTVDEPRNVVKQIRWTASEWAEVERKAEGAGTTPSQLIRGAVLTKSGARIK